MSQAFNFLTTELVNPKECLIMSYHRVYWVDLAMRTPESSWERTVGGGRPHSRNSPEFGKFVHSWCSVTQPCPTLCDPMDCSIQGFPGLHHLQDLAQTQVQWVSDAIHPSISSSVIPFSSRLQSFPASGCFPMSWLFTSGDQSIGPSYSALIPLMNIQDLFPLGLTSLISLLTKGLSRVFSNTTVQKHQFFDAQLSLWSNSHIHTWLLEKP